MASSCSLHLRIPQGTSGYPTQDTSGYLRGTSGLLCALTALQHPEKQVSTPKPPAKVPRNRLLISDWTLTDMLLNVRGGLRKQDSRTGLVVPLGLEHRAQY